MPWTDSTGPSTTLEAGDTELMAKRDELERELQAAERAAQEAKHRLEEFDRQHPLLRSRIRGNRIRQAREQMRLSRTMLARIAGVSPSTLSALERGTRRDACLPTLDAVSEMLGMTVDQLWRGEWEAVS